MTSIIPGASSYLNAATLANLRGVAAQSPTLLGAAVSGELLSSASAIKVPGYGIGGLSSGARSVNQQFLNNTSEVNKMFSLGVGIGATIEGLQAQVLALRARLPEEQIAPAARGIGVDEIV